MSVCLSVCVLVPSSGTRIRVDWRLLVKEHIAKLRISFFLEDNKVPSIWLLALLRLWLWVLLVSVLLSAYVERLSVLPCTGSFTYECFLIAQLEYTARYAGFLLAPAKGFGLRPRAFFALWALSFLCCFCLLTDLV